MTDNKNLQHWASLTAFSVVSLASLTSSFDDGSADWVREQKWAVSATSISLCIGAFSFLASMFKRDLFAGTHVEHFAVRCDWNQHSNERNDIFGSSVIVFVSYTSSVLHIVLSSHPTNPYHGIRSSLLWACGVLPYPTSSTLTALLL